MAQPGAGTYDITINDFSFPFTIVGLADTTYDHRTRNPVAVSVSVVAHNAAGMSLPATVIVPAG